MSKPQVFTYSVTTPPPAGRPHPVRGHHHPLGGERRRAAPEGRGARRAGRADCTASPAPSTARRPSPSPSTCSPAPTRCRSPPPSGRRWRRICQALPGRAALRHPVRHDALRRGLDRGGRHHLRRGDRAGRAGGLPVPAERAGDDHPGDRRAGVDHRHLRRHVRAGLLDQPPDAVRAGAGHRHRRRRRHRGAGERRAHHVDRGQVAARRRASRPCRR